MIAEEKKVCTKCHNPRFLSEFNKRGNKCRAQCRYCDAEYMEKWRTENKEHERAYQSVYRVEHKEERSLQFKIWYGNNREYQQERLCKWNEENREHVLQYRQETKESKRQKDALYKLMYPERVIASKANYRQGHREELRIKGRTYGAENREAIRIRQLAHAQTPRGKAVRRLIRQRYLARKANAAGTFTLVQFFARCEFYGWCCYLCGKHLTLETIQIEHRIPLSRNGTNWPANLAPSCGSCNRKKHMKTEREYRELMQSRQKTDCTG